MKRLAAILCMFLLMMSASANEIQITLNGEALKTDAAPVMESERVLVPMRAIFEALGAKVEWEGDSNTVFAFSGEKIIVLQIDATSAFVNNQTVTLDVPARLVGDRTMVPVRFVSETLGAKVDWDETSSTVKITKDKVAETAAPAATPAAETVLPDTETDETEFIAPETTEDTSEADSSETTEDTESAGE